MITTSKHLRSRTNNCKRTSYVVANMINNLVIEGEESNKKGAECAFFVTLYLNALRHFQLLLNISNVAFEFFIRIDQVFYGLAGVDHGRMVAAAEEAAY